MGETYITDEGKTELLRLGFQSGQTGGAFSYMALGGSNSTGAQGGTWGEVSGSGYERVTTNVDKNENKSIVISATFNETNYAPTDGQGQIKEIGLCNSRDGGTFFMYSEVPSIYKTGDISLQYTIIISID